MPERRFPPPWTAEVTPNCFIVRDANDQALSYIYYESEPGRRSAAKLLSKDKERRIAAKYRAPGATEMSELLQFMIVAAFGALCFGCGYLTAFIVTRNLSFPKIPSGLDRIVRQNHRIIDSNVCDPARAWNVRGRHVQVAEPA
jgi:hypothetical protein